jgi:hypothetical protein
MKTFCIHIPRTYMTEAVAVWDSNWKVTTGAVMADHLQEVWQTVRDTWGLEIYSHEQTEYICFTAEGSTIDVLGGTFYSVEANAEIREIPDFTKTISDKALIATAEIRNLRPEILPFDTYLMPYFNPAEPIAGVLSRFPSDRKAIIQFVCKPRVDTLWLQIKLLLQRIQWKAMYSIHWKYFFKDGVVKKVNEEMGIKSREKFFLVNMRIAVIQEPDSPLTISRNGKRGDKEILKELTENVDSLFAVMSWVNASDRNKLKMDGGVRYGMKNLIPFQQRLLKRGWLLTVKELASHWQIPKMRQVPHAAMVLSTKGSPPKLLPTNMEDPNICFLGTSDYRDQKIPFGVKRVDRQRHMYIVGKSGVGKSCLLQLLLKNDIDNGYGAAVLDPHGDLIDNILKMVPRHRVNDVIIFDPTDSEFPPSFNPMANVSPDMRLRFTSSLLEVFKRALGGAWSEQIEHVLRYSILALLTTPGATLLSLQRMLADEQYRKMAVDTSQDTAVKDFWNGEFQARKEELYTGAIIPLLNHLGQLLAVDTLRNIFGQPINRFNMREIMDQRKILLIKLPKGILGAHNTAMLGSMFIAKIYEAAMSRADIAPEARTDFYFYVDEFQNFATEAFEEILSEARKYRLCLTVANQFLGQLSENIRKALIGNVGNLITFRVGGEDAPLVANEIKPRFAAEDLINLAFRDFYIKMMVDGEVQDSFSGRTLDLDPLIPKSNFLKQCIDHSRKKYCMPLKHVKGIVGMWDSEMQRVSSGQ